MIVHFQQLRSTEDVANLAQERLGTSLPTTSGWVFQRDHHAGDASLRVAPNSINDIGSTRKRKWRRQPHISSPSSSFPVLVAGFTLSRSCFFDWLCSLSQAYLPGLRASEHPLFTPTQGVGVCSPCYRLIGAFKYSPVWLARNVPQPCISMLLTMTMTHSHPYF